MIPFGRDEDFVGREDILEVIQQKLSTSGSSLRRLALVGLGGVGSVKFDHQC